MPACCGQQAGACCVFCCGLYVWVGAGGGDRGRNGRLVTRWGTGDFQQSTQVRKSIRCCSCVVGAAAAAAAAPQAGSMGSRRNVLLAKGYP